MTDIQEIVIISERIRCHVFSPTKKVDGSDADEQIMITGAIENAHCDLLI